MNKRIVVCGASQGIGAAIVHELAKNPNHEVIALSRNKALMAFEFKEYSNVHPYAFDLEKDVKQQAQVLFGTGEAINVLINNAGYLVHEGFENTSEDQFQSCLQVNYLGPVTLIQALLHSLRSGNAHIVNISTMGAVQGSVKFPGLSAYAASKAALCTFTEVFAEEYKMEPIRMNCLCLGAVNTEMLQRAFPGYEAKTSPKEMASFIVNFALNAGLLMNGKIVSVSSSTP
jgi:NAD(P)-dependent dehydrogenase (short-subunit alcohol dehydrogenase family)